MSSCKKKFGMSAGIGVILIFICFVSQSEGCTCNVKHPQQHVCEADFVMKVRIRRPISTPDGLTAYKFKIKKVMKADTKSLVSLSKRLLYTIPGQCDIRLKQRVTYVIAGDVEGGKAWANACSFVKKWRELTPKMKKGIKLLYQTGCDCQIMSCHWWDRCPPGNFFCPWETSRDEEDCQEKHGVCLRRPDGSCSWLGGSLYRTCMKNRTMTTNNARITNHIYDPKGSLKKHRISRKRKLLLQKRNRLKSENKRREESSLDRSRNSLSSRQSNAIQLSNTERSFNVPWRMNLHKRRHPKAFKLDQNLINFKRS